MRGAPSLILIAALAGCASLGPAQETDPFSDPGSRQVRVHVRNLNFSDARLYALSSGGRQRLGTIAGKQDAVYTLPWLLADDLRIEINLVAGPVCTTEVLRVDPGDELDLEIEEHIRSDPVGSNALLASGLERLAHCR